MNTSYFSTSLPNSTNVNLKSQGNITRTPLQSKTNRNIIATMESNSKKTPDLKWKNLTSKPTLHQEEDNENSNVISHDDLTDEDLLYNKEKNCQKNCFHMHEPKLKLNFSDPPKLGERCEKVEEEINVNSSTSSSQNEILTYVNIIDIEKMKKVDSWINDGLIFDGSTSEIA